MALRRSPGKGITMLAIKIAREIQENNLTIKTDLIFWIGEGTSIEVEWLTGEDGRPSPEVAIVIPGSPIRRFKGKQASDIITQLRVANVLAN